MPCLLVSCAAQAFNYNEHKQFYVEARTLLSDDARARLGVFETIELELLTRENVSPRAGFEVSDVPALAGDYSTDVANLLNRLFLGGETELACAAVDAGAVEKPKPPRAPVVCESPQSTTARTGPFTSKAWTDFIGRQRDWNEQTKGKREMPDFGLDAPLGSALLRLALKNMSHFSVSQCEGAHRNQSFEVQRDFVFEQDPFTYGGRPNLVSSSRARETAVAYYLENHLGAVVFLSLAKELPPSSADARAAQALGVLLEQFALHYLTDLVAPGHQLREQVVVNDAAQRRAQHAERNRSGLLVAVPAPVCGMKGVPKSLASACRDKRDIQVFGDGFAFWSPIAKAEQSETADLAAALAAVSMQEALDLSVDWKAPAPVELKEALLDGKLGCRQRFAHLGELLTGNTPARARMAVWAEAWGLGPKTPTTDGVDQLHVQVMTNLVNQGAGKALALVPVYAPTEPKKTRQR